MAAGDLTTTDAPAAAVERADVERAEEAAERESLRVETDRESILIRRRSLLRTGWSSGLLIFLVALIGICWAASPYFMNVSNIQLIAQLSGLLGVMAVAQTLLVLSGGIDISVGSVAACASVVIGYLFAHGWNVWLAALVALIGGLAVGLVNGVITVIMGIPALVTTIAMYLILYGVSYLIIGTSTITIDANHFPFIGAGFVWGIPMTAVIFIGLWLVGFAVLRGTAVGRHIYAIGDNLEAADRAGIRTRRVRIILFMITAASGALAGILITGQLTTASAEIGAPYLLSVVIAVILGGTSLAGGRGTLFGTLVAVAILGVLQNNFSIHALPVTTQDIVEGALLIVAVNFDRLVSRLERL
jgi:ribose transport system permease protein